MVTPYLWFETVSCHLSTHLFSHQAWLQRTFGHFTIPDIDSKDETLSSLRLIRRFSGSPLRRLWRMTELRQVENEPPAPWGDYAEGQQAFGCVGSVLYFQNRPCFTTTQHRGMQPMTAYERVDQATPERGDWGTAEACLGNSHLGHRPTVGPGLRLGAHLLSHLLPPGNWDYLPSLPPRKQEEVRWWSHHV